MIYLLQLHEAAADACHTIAGADASADLSPVCADVHFPETVSSQQQQCIGGVQPLCICEYC